MHIVSLLIPESVAMALTALIGNCMTAEVCTDLGLDELYKELADNFRVNLDGAQGLVCRNNREIAASVTSSEYPRYTRIDIT